MRGSCGAPERSKRRLTDEIIDQLGEPFSGKGRGPQITDVFYTSFVIQQQ